MRIESISLKTLAISILLGLGIFSTVLSYLSGNQFRRRCHDEFLHHLRVREWQDLVAQLRQAAKGVGIGFTGAPAEPFPWCSAPARCAAPKASRRASARLMR